MSYAVSLVLLFLAAVLEAGGDALMRLGIYRPATARRFLFFLAGGLVLTTYDYTVNAPNWDFGRLFGRIRGVLLPGRTVDRVLYIRSKAVDVHCRRRFADSIGRADRLSG